VNATRLGKSQGGQSQLAGARLANTEAARPAVAGLSRPPSWA